MSIGTHARLLALLPQDCPSCIQESLKVDHRYDGVEQKANKVRQNDMRDAIC